MTRLTLAAGLAAAALLAPAAFAGAPAIVTDPANDWQLAQQDIRLVRVEGVRTGNTHVLRATLTLSAAPDAGSEYAVSVSRGCHWWVFDVRGVGTSVQRATLSQGSCGDATSPVPQPSVPATVSVRGNAITFSAPYAFGLKRSFRLDYVSAVAAYEFAMFWVGPGVTPDVGFTAGDIAGGPVTYWLP